MPQNQSNPNDGDQGPDLENLIPEPDLLPCEDPVAYQALKKALLEELAPVTFQETALAHEIVDCHWQHFRDKQLARDLDDLGFRKAARDLHMLRNDVILPSQADKDLHDALHSKDLDTLKGALAILEEQGISQNAIRVRAYIQHFKETETLGRRTGRNDDRRRALRKEFDELVALRPSGSEGTTGMCDDDNA